MQKESYKRLESNVKSVQAKMGRLMAEFAKTRDEITSISQWREESFGTIEMKSFAERLHRRLESLEAGIKQIHEQYERDTQDMKARFRSMEKSHEDVIDLSGDIRKADMIGMRREIEKLSAKSSWIENNIESIDIGPIAEKVAELESRIRLLKYSNPIIIE